jgi:hypothetical protein
MNHVQKMNRTELVDLTLFYNFYSLHFSVGRVSVIQAFLKKKSPKVPWGPKLGALTVCLSIVLRIVFVFIFIFWNYCSRLGSCAKSFWRTRPWLIKRTRTCVWRSSTCLVCSSRTTRMSRLACSIWFRYDGLLEDCLENLLFAPWTMVTKMK